MNAFQTVMLAAVLFLPLYILPSILAGVRKHRHTAAVVALNILLGWTGIGWVAALVWSLMNTREAVK